MWGNFEFRTSETIRFTGVIIGLVITDILTFKALYVRDVMTRGTMSTYSISSMIVASCSSSDIPSNDSGESLGGIGGIDTRGANGDAE